MFPLINRRGFLAAFGLALLAVQSPVAAQAPLDASVKRVLFLGDSITYAGQYVDYVEAAWRLKYPESQVEFLDVGLPSETVSGLSEPGHAGGKFPRPDLHERLDRVLAQVKPQLVIACYGMNDGIYHPYSVERAKAFEAGMVKLHNKVEAIGAKIIHLTPPVFDAQPIKAKTLPAGREVYEQPYEGYDEVLGKYGEWLLKQREKGWVVYDVHGPMLESLLKRRKEDPNFKFAGDGVHADANGHWLMAGALLNGWKMGYKIDLATLQRDGGEWLKLISQRRKVLSDAWLTATEHKRPGMAKGLPLAEADVKAVELDKRIRELQKTITIK